MDAAEARSKLVKAGYKLTNRPPRGWSGGDEVVLIWGDTPIGVLFERDGKVNPMEVEAFIENANRVTPAGRIAELEELVRSFVLDEIDYMTRNHLGDPEEKHNIKWARRLGISDTLAKKLAP